MDKKELKKAENEFVGGVDVSATESNEVPEGFTAMNPPATKTEVDVVSQETTDRIKILDGLVRDLATNFVKIGFELLQFQQKKLYKELGFKTFEEFVKGQYGFSRSSAYNFINVCNKYSIHDDAGLPTKLLKKDYRKFTCSQLVAMLKLNDEAIAQVDPSSTIKEIKKLATSQTAEETATEEDAASGESESTKDKDKKEKKNVRDINIPVMRLSMATGLTWEDAVNEKVKKVCEHYLNDERRAKDGKQYKIEINIIYPDESAM